MLKWLGSLVDSNEKEIKRLQPFVDRINELEPEFKGLSDEALRAKTAEFRARVDEATADTREQIADAKQELERKRGKASEDSGDHETEALKKQQLEDEIKKLEDIIGQLEKELHKKAIEFLDRLLPDAFAAVREAAWRTIGQRHFDVQLMGGIVLHQGKIAEMKTGEGKTLVATLPLYLNALTGEGCHLVTVNDYLSKRDSHWMGPVFHALGITVGSIQHEASFIYDPTYNSDDPRWPCLRPVPRKEAYAADIAYGTNNEFGFDYLRDNMVVDLAQCVQRKLNYAIVDEVDNILIDESRTPLIISGPAEESAKHYELFARLVPRLREEEDYKVEEKTRAVTLTDAGIGNIEGMLRREGLLQAPSLYDPANYALARYLDSVLKACVLYRKDRDYVVKDGEVIIVDEFTGRLMPGRRYSEGLHQAIEAKEHVRVQRETLTYATITFQNYFRTYGKLAGMTGTAVTEAEEFHKIYMLEVVVIPTNKPMKRDDFPDRIYKDEETKFRAVVRDVEEKCQQKQPALIGTVSIEKSERLSDMLKRKGIPHQVLNAKLHEKEAGIIAQAGRLGAVTVATNMAGRGVDIILGGNPAGRDDKEWQQEHDEVVRVGGLQIIGTERHEARRIDNQLRGRAGRQGDPGSTRFYVSLEDDIMKRFGGDRIKGLMEWAGMGEDTPIENKLVTRSIEGAQTRVEGYHFDVRKQLVEYDDVVNKHRELIYTERRKILSGADLKANIVSMLKDEVSDAVRQHIGEGYDNNEALPDLLAELNNMMPLPPTVTAESLAPLRPKEIEQGLAECVDALYEQKEKELTPQNMRLAERLVMLRIMDSLWVEHLTAMEHMRLEAGWQQLRQMRAVDAYRNEGFKQFQVLTSTIRHDVAHTIFHVNITRQEAPRPQQPVRQSAFKQPMASPMTKVVPAGNQGIHAAQKVAGKKVGRNDPCPCGSGKKYKFCCGR